MKRLLIVLSIVAVLLPMAACGNGDTDDTAAIKDTIKGYITTYNAEDFAKCLTHFTDYGDEEEARAALAFFRTLSGKLDLKEVRDVSITGQTATATVVFTILGEQGEDQLHLKKVQGQWKIIWDQEQEDLTGDAAAIRDTLVGYLVAYNAGDFAKCLTYLTGFGDEQEAKDSLSLIREHIGTITFRGISSIYITGDTATANVDHTFWSTMQSSLMDFCKDAAVWKIAWGRPGEIGIRPPAPMTVNQLISGTIEIAPQLRDLLEIRICMLEGNDGTHAWLWETWQVRNTGDEKLYLGQNHIVCEYYDEDGAYWGGGSSGLYDLGPGQSKGNSGGGLSYAVGYGPSHYKAFIDITG